MSDLVGVSVTIPTFNREKGGYLKKAIESVLSQSYSGPMEVLVCDDGSTDNTKQMVTEMMKKDKRVKYLFQSNRGCASALNMGIKRSRYPFWAWLSSDDWYDLRDNKLIEKSVKMLVKHPNVGMTYVDYTVHQPDRVWEFVAPKFETREIPNRSAQLAEMFKTCYICGSGIVVKKEVFYTIGFFNENFKYGQDYEFYFRVLTQFDLMKVDFEKFPMLNYFYEPKHECLGKKITEGKHDNESSVVVERFNLMTNPNRPKCCAMLCVKNESALINQCLNDLSMYIDHIVLLDDGSYDGTANMAAKWKKVKKIHRQKDKGDKRCEGKDRQKMLDMAYKTGADFFLFIDCDEIFEDMFKTEIYKQMMDSSVDLWFYKEINFWRSLTYHRIDELYDKGWFGRLFRATEGLAYRDQDEHCGGIPMNLPGGPEKERRSHIRVKHYGFCTERRLLHKFRSLWKREKNRLTMKQLHEHYDRLLDESTLTMKRYYERPYWYREEDPAPVILTKEQFGVSEAMQEELKEVLKRRKK